MYRFLHPSAAIDVLADVWRAVIGLEYAVGTSYDCDVLSALLWDTGIACGLGSALTAIEVASDVRVKVLTGVNVKDWVAAVSYTHLTLPTTPYV